MLNLLFLIIIFLLISIIILLLNFLISKKSITNREKSSPFECGFDPISYNRIPFRIHFFLTSLIFLIFDIEITLLIPLIYILFSLNLTIIFSSFILIIIILLGLYLEYLEKSLDWKIN